MNEIYSYPKWHDPFGALMIREPDSHFDPPEDRTNECKGCGKLYADMTGYCAGCQQEPDDDPGPIIDRDCDYWNRVT